MTVYAYTYAMNPPKCKTCGKAEWHHTCGVPITQADIQAKMKDVFANPHGDRLLLRPGLKGSDPLVAGVHYMSPNEAAARIPSKPKTDRKAYLAQKAKERRARQKAAKT